MVQTTIRSRQPKWAAEGQTATANWQRVAGAMQNFYNGNAGVLPFGRIAAYDPDTNKITTLTAAPASGDFVTLPIFVERHGLSYDSLISSTAANPPELGYPESDMELVETATLGDFVMWSETAVRYGDPVFVRQQTVGANPAGRVRAGAAANFFELPDLEFSETISAPGFVAVAVSTRTGVMRIA